MDLCREVTVEEAAAQLRSADRILILCHQKPDGDTLGSGLALLYGLQGLGKMVRIACSDGFPQRYHFLYDGFEPECQPQFSPELVVAVDIADPQLFGEETACWADRVDLCIDHHPSNSRYARQLLLDVRAAGTVEAISQVLDALGVSIDRRIATCIYTGMATDTGCFRYSNTTSDTHRLAARMMDCGVDAYQINKLMFETKSVARMELERLVMDTLEYHCNKRVAMIVISLDMITRTGVPEQEREGIAAIPRQIEGVDVAVTFTEKQEGVYRISMRSGERVNSSAVCARLGGGGHARAAGCTIEGSLEQAKEAILQQLKAELDIQSS